MSVLLQVLLECLGEVNKRLTSTELGALDHALLVEDKQVSTAGQHVAVLLPVHPRCAVRLDVTLESVDKLCQVSGKIFMQQFIFCNFYRTIHLIENN